MFAIPYSQFAQKENRALAGPVQYVGVGAPTTSSRGEQLLTLRSPIWEDGGDRLPCSTTEYAIPIPHSQRGDGHVSHAVRASRDVCAQPTRR
jgi:hypothetical protein